MIRNVIFDLDGTLLDTTEGVLESVKFTAKELGYPELPYEELRTFIGPPVQLSFIKHYGCDEKKAQRAADLFRSYYKGTSLFKAKPYDGIFALCEAFKSNNIRMAVATYKREDYALALLCHFGFDRYCDSMHGADNFNELKKEDIVELCRKELGALKGECVFVGDTMQDAAGASKAGITFLAVTYGFGFRTEKDVQEYPHIGIAGSPAEIADLVLNQ